MLGGSDTMPGEAYFKVLRMAIFSHQLQKLTPLNMKTKIEFQVKY